jgi:hypothetical protein
MVTRTWGGLTLFLINYIVHYLGTTSIYMHVSKPGADPGGGGGAPPKIGKNMIFWRKIVIFHTIYPNKFRASLRSAQFF